MRKPHARGNAFARDVPKHSQNPGPILRQGSEVAGEKTCREDFAGKLDIAAAQCARAAELALNLRSLEHLRMQVRPLPQQRENVLLQRHL